LIKNSHKTEVGIAIIGLIGVLGAAVITNWDKIFPDRSAGQTAPKANEQRPATPTGSSVQESQGSGISGCFDHYFSGLPRDRIAVL